MNQSCFIPFNTSVDHISPPKQFTFPFYYEPHPLTIIAAKELQHYLKTQTDWEHNFGLDPKKRGLVIGKMFGVLVVENQHKELGYLTAFSGKLAGKNAHTRFVPPVFDMLEDNSFFIQGEKIVNQLNASLEQKLQDQAYLDCLKLVEKEKEIYANRLKVNKDLMRAAKKKRRERRKTGEATLNETDLNELKEALKYESLKYQYYLRHFNAYWEARLTKSQAKLEVHTNEINTLKAARKAKSSSLQKQLFQQYRFLNIKGAYKSLESIFEHTFFKTPPAGAGECAAPKLLHYTFKHSLKPIAIAEFWWGASPKSKIRKHGNFYPACRGKCEPILGHMLEGMDVEENPMLTNPALGKVLETIYEDEHLLVINKPSEFLSVPGKTIHDSVAYRIQQKYPNASGPLIVHRLDMSTSGLMLIAKNPDVYRLLQRQFINRSIKKRYIAVLDGLLTEKKGYVNLPIRVDLEDRPRQMVCYEFGKSARTKWEIIEQKDNKTRVHFYPITGRTHQLRVHAAHADGLNTPIVGDDLYGKKDRRLMLHAEMIEFEHPISKERMTVQVDPDF